MNDLELARLISGEVGEHFTLAKEVAEDYPGYCLVTLRGMCKLVCLRIIEVQNLAIPRAAELATLIREVCDRTNSDSQTKDSLHKLRWLGNKGAHPEEGQFDLPELAGFARSALEYAITVLKFAHTQVHPNSLLPSVIICSPMDSGVKSLCYRATIQEEIEPQHWLGKHFLNRAAIFEMGREGSLVFPYEIHEEKKKANYWFKLAANQGHAAALYEHGRLLIEGGEGKEYVNMGVNNVFRAANAGNSDANADVGHIYYHGAHDQPKDFVEARKYFEIAAAEDHPSALTMLGVMYLRGEGGPVNQQAAFDYTRKSAEAGYPTGQYNLFIHYWNGTTVEMDQAEALVWLTNAAEQRFPEALFALAGLISDGLVAGKSLQDAETLLAKCMNAANTDQPLRSKAMLQYARLLSRHHDNLQLLTGAADMLQRCYESEDGKGEIACACTALSIELVEKIKKLISSRHGSADEITAASMTIGYMFDKAGKPIPKRNAGLGKLNDDLQKTSEAKKHLSPELYKNHVLRTFQPCIFDDGRHRSALRLASATNTKVGRNDPCPCNSGKKHKHCCGLS